MVPIYDIFDKWIRVITILVHILAVSHILAILKTYTFSTNYFSYVKLPLVAGLGAGCVNF